MPRGSYAPSLHIRGLEHRSLEAMAILHHVQALQRTHSASVDRCIEIYCLWYCKGEMSRFSALKVLYSNALAELKEIIDVPSACKECPPVAA